MKANEIFTEGVKLATINQPFGVIGSPGLGKTSIVKAIAEELELEYVEVRAAEFEPIDFRGGLYLDSEEQLAKWFPAEIWPTEKCLICLDELNQATPDIISPLMKLVLGRQIGKTVLHPETVIVMTGNRVSDRAGCTRMSSALRDRFIMLDIDADLNEWTEWYKEQPDHNPMVLQYLSQHPKNFHSWDPKIEGNQPSPRNWEKAGCVINVTQHKEVLTGVLGADVAQGFTSWLHTNISVPEVTEVLNGDKDAPTDPVLISVWVDKLSAKIQSLYGGDGKTPATQYDALMAEIFQLAIEVPSAYQILLLKNLKENNCSQLLLESPWKSLLKQHHAALKAAADSQNN